MTARRWAMYSWAACLAATMATLVFLAMGIDQSTPGDTFVIGGGGGFAFAFASLAFGTVGALVAARLPENRVGWVFCVIGLSLGLGNLAYQYADQVLYGSATSLPGGVIAAWLQNLLIPPMFGVIALSLMVFPDGRLPSRRWWPAVVPPVAGAALEAVGYALRPGRIDDPFATVDNPFGITGAFSLFEFAAAIGWPLMLLGLVFAAAALRARLRRSGGLVRQQLKWVAFAAAVAGVLVGFDVASFFWFENPGLNVVRTAALAVGFSIIPIAAGVAILRYRLYDIDVVINRALVYAALTATLAAVYLGSILLLQVALRTFTAGSGLAVAASTLATAALVGPARTRIQATVDRRFYRRKYDASRTLDTFGARLRDEIDLETLQDDLRAVVAETMQPAHVTLWLRHEKSDPVTISGRTNRRQESS